MSRTNWLEIEWHFMVDDEFAFSSIEGATRHDSQDGSLKRISLYETDSFPKWNERQWVGECLNHWQEWCKLLGLNGTQQYNTFIEIHGDTARMLVVPLGRQECTMSYQVKRTTSYN